MFMKKKNLNFIMMMTFMVTILYGCIQNDDHSITTHQTLTSLNRTRAINDSVFQNTVEIPQNCQISSISPDHMYLGLTCDAGKWVASIDGKEEPIQLLSGTEAWRNAEFWSPDSKILALSAPPSSSVKLYLTNDWSDIKMIDLGESFRTSLSGGWSPDSQYLAMTNTEGQLVLSLINQNGTIQNLITKEDNLFHSPKFTAKPTWSPDSNKLALLILDDNNEQLWNIDIKTGERNLLYEIGEYSVLNGLSWSPDARRIAFTLYQPVDSIDNEWRDVVYTYNLEENKLEKIYTPDTNPHPFFWSLDGTHLIITDKPSEGITKGERFFEIISMDTFDSIHLPIEISGKILGWTKSGDGILIAHEEDSQNYSINIIPWN